MTIQLAQKAFPYVLNALPLLYQCRESWLIHQANQSPEQFEAKQEPIYNSSMISMISGYFYLATQIGYLLLNNRNVSPIIQKQVANWILVGPFLAFGAAAVVSMVALPLLNRFFQPSMNPQEFVEEGAVETTVSFEKSSQHKDNEMILCTKMVITLALSYFSKYKVFLLAAAALQGASLLAMSRWVTVKYSKIFRQFEGILGYGQIDHQLVPIRGKAVDPHITAMRVSYCFPILPALNGVEENCAVCGPSEERPYQLCARHITHLECLTRSIGVQFKAFDAPNGNRWMEHFDNPTRTHHTHRNEYGDTFDQYMKYKVLFAKEAFLTCAECHYYRASASLEVEIMDSQYPGRYVAADVEMSSAERILESRLSRRVNQ